MSWNYFIWAHRLHEKPDNNNGSLICLELSSKYGMLLIEKSSKTKLKIQRNFCTNRIVGMKGLNKKTLIRKRNSLWHKAIKLGILQSKKNVMCSNQSIETSQLHCRRKGTVLFYRYHAKATLSVDCTVHKHKSKHTHNAAHNKTIKVGDISCMTSVSRWFHNRNLLLI